MSRKPSYIFVIDDTIFDREVLVVLGSTQEELIAFIDADKKEWPITVEELEWLNDPERYQLGAGFSMRMHHSWYILYVSELSNTPRFHEVLAHEVFHTADVMIRRAGIKLSEDSDEIWAYLIGWMTKRIRRMIMDRNKVET